MPRSSPFFIELTGQEREELESHMRKYTSPYCEVIRAKIVLLAAGRLPPKSSLLASIPLARSSASGASASLWRDSGYLSCRQAVMSRVIWLLPAIGCYSDANSTAIAAVFQPFRELGIA